MNRVAIVDGWSVEKTEAEMKAFGVARVWPGDGW